MTLQLMKHILHDLLIKISSREDKMIVTDL